MVLSQLSENKLSVHCNSQQTASAIVWVIELLLHSNTCQLDNLIAFKSVHHSPAIQLHPVPKHSQQVAAQSAVTAVQTDICLSLLQWPSHQSLYKWCLGLRRA